MFADVEYNRQQNAYLVVAGTLAAAFFFSLFLRWFGVMEFMPPWVLLVVLYWSMVLPRVVGLTWAWAVGFVMDIQGGGLLGQHALGFLLIAAIVHFFYPRIRAATLVQQAVTFAVLALLFQFYTLFVHGISAVTLPSQWYWLQAPLSAIAWPILVFVLRSARYRFVTR